VTFNPYAPPVMERLRVKRALENMIREMLADKNGGFTFAFRYRISQE
jgi:hypothetical protein